jgi:hypothetical protein
MDAVNVMGVWPNMPMAGGTPVTPSNRICIGGSPTQPSLIDSATQPSVSGGAGQPSIGGGPQEC